MISESHTGVVLAKAFQEMLERFGLEEKIHSVTADNASSNNVQLSTLYQLENSFDEANHVRCFNHTIQLSGKVLIKPFNAGMGKLESGFENSPDDAPSLEEFDHDDDTDDGDAGLFEDRDEEDGEDEDEPLSDSVLDNTSAVRETVSKVCVDHFQRWLH